MSIDMLDLPDNPRQLPALRYELVLPFPPSVNRIWKFVGVPRDRGAVPRSKSRVTRDPDYQRWLETGDGCVLEQLGIPAYRRPIAGRYELVLTLDVTRFGKVDQDNCIKAVSDLLQRNNIVENDKFAWKTHILWGRVASPHKQQPACSVSVRQIR